MIAGDPTSLLSHLHVLIAEDDALIAFDMERVHEAANRGKT